MARQVVVIDDEPDILAMMRVVLELEGYSVLCLERPSELPAVWANGDPAVFLIDVMLPGLSGIELARALRAAGFAQTPMIAMSASPLMLSAAQATGLFQDTLPKPFDLGRLLTCITQLGGQLPEEGASA
jgi:CheY-like chemotaxis protein